MKLLVTGASGYFGSRLACSLAEKGHIVHALVRNQSSPFLPRHKNILTFQGDILDVTSIRNAMPGCEYVFHAAALVKLNCKNPADFFRINVTGTRNMLDVALEMNVRKFIFTSSCGVLGPSLHGPLYEEDPRIGSFNNDYELTKYMAEKLVKEYCSKGLSGVIANLSKVFGPGHDTHPVNVNKLIKNCIRKQVCFVPYPANYLSNYVYIEDAVKGHLLLIDAGLTGERYIIGGENLSFFQFYDHLHAVSGSRPKLIPVPKMAAQVICKLSSSMNYLRGKEATYSLSGVKHIYSNRAYSCNKAIRELGYSITPFKEALQKTIQFLNGQSCQAIVTP